MAGMDILASAFSGGNATFLADLYARWATDPASVDPSFAELFGAMNDEARSVLEDATGASWAPRTRLANGDGAEAAQSRTSTGPVSDEQIRAITIRSLR